jgi:hypothetical protein
VEQGSIDLEKRQFCPIKKDPNQWIAMFASPLILDLEDHVGHVCAAFHKGIYLTGPMGFLWNIVDQPAKMNAYGVCIQTLSNSFHEFKQDDIYIFEKKRITLPSLNTTIDLRSCRLWRPGPSIWKSKFSLKQWVVLKQEIDHSIASLTKYFFSGGNEVNQILFEQIGALGKAVSKGDMEGSLKAGYRLIGMGPGLTPVGDDFLCGFGLALFYLSRLSGEGINWVEKWQGSIAREASGKTVVFSTQCLELARAGQSAWAVCSLLEKIFYDWKPGKVARLGRNILAIGASTGAAILEGIRSGLSSFTEGFIDRSG